jgi:hypothetical protein
MRWNTENILANHSNPFYSILNGQGLEKLTWLDEQNEENLIFASKDFTQISSLNDKIKSLKKTTRTIPQAKNILLTTSKIS